jgi:mannose-P-dolichol utilization defect protein 1
METIIAPTLDKAITPLRPFLLPITRNLPAPLNSFLITLLGSPCHSALFRDLRFADTPEHACFSLLVSKTLGLAIIGVSSVVKIPQILKLLNSRSSDGISFLSYALETASFVISLAYNARSGFPFSTYGETALIAVQDVVVSVLVLHFAGKDAAAGVFVAGLAAVVYTLLSGESLVDMQTLSYLQAGAGVLSVASKAPQIWAVWQQGGTGQLSAFAVCMDCCRCGHAANRTFRSSTTSLAPCLASSLPCKKSTTTSFSMASLQVSS